MDTQVSEKSLAYNLDVKRKDVSHISGWKDRAEFEQVYNFIFETPLSDVESKQAGLDAIQVWKVRQGKHTPVSVLCTITILEAQILDANYQRQQPEGKENNIVEVKSLYGSAFTRFINYLTEHHQQSGVGRKGSMSSRVKEVGIEGFLVELRHLCSHSSLSISIDIFRRSGEYCMNWLKDSYWVRTLEIVQDCNAKDVKYLVPVNSVAKLLKYIAYIYDIATNAIHKGAKTFNAAKNYLSQKQFTVLRNHCILNKTKQLDAVVTGIVRYFSLKMKNLKRYDTTPLVCKSFLNCPYMFEAPVDGCTQGLVQVHQYLFQTLVADGYIQTYLELLIEICENDQKTHAQRLGAKFWATEIVKAFQVLRKFKQFLKGETVKSPQFDPLEHTRKMSKHVQAIYQNELRIDLQNTIIIGVSVNCPWHLRLSRCYLMERVKNVNAYTKDILPIIAALVEPQLKHPQLELLEAATEKYTVNGLAATEDEQMEEEINNQSSTIRQNVTKRGNSPKIYTVEDVLDATEHNGSKHPKRDTIEIENSPILNSTGAVTNSIHIWADLPLGRLSEE